MDGQRKDTGGTRYRTTCLAILVVALTAVGLYACTNRRVPAVETVHPVVIMGMDGLDWDVALPLIHAGRLPHLADLASRGRAGNLQTLRPTISPAIWTTAATGVLPAQHGIRGFVKNRGEATALYTSRDRRVKTLWDIAGDAGLRSIVIGWWATFPVERTEGVVVAQVNTLPSMRRKLGETLKGGPKVGTAGQVWPPERQEELLSLVQQVDAELPALAERLSDGADFSHDPVVDRFWRESMWSLRADTSYTRMAELLLKEPQQHPALVAVYTGLTDVIAHRFWAWAYPQSFSHQPKQEAVAAYGALVARAYEQADASLGRLIDAAPDDAVFVVLSDHGMEAHNRNAHFDAATADTRVSAGHHHAPAGVLVVAGPNIIAGQDLANAADPDQLPTLGGIADITPTVLALLGLPAGEDMPGQVIEEIIAPEFLEAHPLQRISSHTETTWQKTREFAGTNLPGTKERIGQLRALGYVE
ncbi:MAG: arylsulfatase A-like enzyme [Hyphomicrobiaceae bacterium]|jgi:arylsulfatase A-like enzyme